MDDAQAGIKIARRNTDNVRYVDDITLMAENEEKLKSLLMKVKEEREKAGLNIQSHHFMELDGETMETVTGFIFLDSKITANGDCSHEIKRPLLLGRKARTEQYNKHKVSVIIINENIHFSS